MTPSEALLVLPPKPVTVILDELVSIRRRSKEDADVVVPLITLHLRSGEKTSGWIVSRALDEKEGDFLLLHSPGGDLQHPHDDATYVPVSTIVAVTVHGIGPVAHLLSFGSIANPLGVAPPTRLEVRRRGEELQKIVSAEVGAAIIFEIDFGGIADGDPFRALLDTVKETASAIKALAKDAMGKEAITKSVRKVHFAEGPEEVVLHEGTLGLTFPFASSPQGKPAKRALQSKISALL